MNARLHLYASTESFFDWHSPGTTGLDGRLREGEQLPTEAKLCDIFGVNRSAVREGICALEEAKLLRREHAGKMVISRPSEREVDT